ncbi:tripartite motif-containing protein 2-like [Ptychodera flava]|uniref:tripartite motif-containing protein 2-like n=1 Tax=Ptychodera flava TaxID=63121 RepID=UPI00396AA896
MAMMKNGDALVCEYGNNRLQTFTVYGQHRRLFRNTGRFCLKDATVSADGNIFCTEDGSKQVFVCDEKGKYIRRFGKGKILSPCGIAISPDSGILYIVDRRAHCVHVYDQDGNRLKLFGSHGRQAGQLNHPTFVCIDSSGNVYVSDSNNHRINVYDSDGNFLYTFGSHGSGRDQLDNPQGVAVDKNGRVYVADNNNNRLLQFTGDGTFISRVDDPQGGLKSPTGVCVTDDDLLMVSDCDNSCVRVFALNQ